MLRRITLPVCLVTFVLASRAMAGGPPQIAIEMPAKAFDRQSQDAALILRATQCGGPLTAEIVGRAEGVVAGKRQSIPLKLRVTSQAGTYAVAKQWPAEGRWVLVFSCESHGEVTAFVDVPKNGAEPKVEVVHRIVDAKEIGARLTS